VIQFSVRGDPVTQGSMIAWHIRGAVCKFGLRPAGSNKLKIWRDLVATGAARAMNHDFPMDGPLRVDLTFFIIPKQPQQKEQYKLGPFVWQKNRNDIDKLERAVLDSMKAAAVYHDDGQVAQLYGEKRWVDGDTAGVIVTVGQAQDKGDRHGFQ
jgi:Holliday junction resolvase RusA-like endonuclease